MSEQKHNMSVPDTTVEQLALHIDAIIRLLGEDPSREGLRKTPVRAAKALLRATEGYRMDVAEAVNGAVFEWNGQGMVMVRDIEFYSMCEHHILPFFGSISVAYIPNGSMIGLSKLARIVDIMARQLQVQERLTREVMREVIVATGSPDVMVSCRAEHLCMKMRGVEKQDASTVTYEASGRFLTDPAVRAQFFEALR